MPFENKAVSVTLQCNGPGYWERVKKAIEDFEKVDVDTAGVDKISVDNVDANKVNVLSVEMQIRGECLKNVERNGNCPGTGELCPFVQRKIEPIDMEELEDRILASEDPYGPNFDPDGD